MGPNKEGLRLARGALPEPVSGVAPGDNGFIAENTVTRGPGLRGEAAIAYAKRGWFVLPLHSIVEEAPGRTRCTCPRRRCEHEGKHPFGRLAPHGYRNASARPETVRFWWGCYPWLNLGVVTGSSGLVVIDVDPRNGGDASLKALVRTHDPPETLTAHTGGGGLHLYLSDPQRLAKTCELAPGLEIKSGGSLVVAAPSRHKSGRLYRWDDPLAPVAPAPEWVLSRRQEAES